MTWDPRDYGCRCDECPLFEGREGLPVMREWPTSPTALLVGEAPGKDETIKGAPFVGRAGVELMSSLAAIGVARKNVALTNVVACRPPDNKYDRFIHGIQKANKGRAARGEELIPLPADCCRPRLVAEVAALPDVILLGGTAYRSFLGNGSIMEYRGGPREISLEVDPGGAGIVPLQIRVLPTLHPSFVMRSKSWRSAFRADLARAFRWFSTGLSWREPSVIYVPTPAQLRAFLESVKGLPLVVWDVETFAGYLNHFEPMADRLKCIGIGVADGRAVVVPFKSVEPDRGPYYKSADQGEIVAIMKWFLTDKAFKRGGWNQRYYDRMVAEGRLGVIPGPSIDGIIAHRVAEPEMPHALAYSGSVRTDVPRWKAGRPGVNSRTDAELWKYNAIDCVVTAMAIPPLVQIARARKQEHLIPVFHRLQDMCVGLHQNGLPVDQAVRKAWDVKLLAQADQHRARIRELAKMPGLNPASFQQVGDLLFERLGVAPHHYTDLGDPSTDDDALRAFLSDTWGLEPEKKALVTAIRDFRRVTKRRGVVVRLRPCIEETVIAEDLVEYGEGDESPAARAERLAEEYERAKKGRSRAPGLVLEDGRVHGDYNAQGTTGWRLSSSGPNMQNLEDKLRDMFVAPRGYVFVACDSAQVELRFVAGLAKCRYYIDRFREKSDPHKALCIDLFGERFLKADPPQQKKLRRCIKELTYSSLYMAEDPTKLEVVTSAEETDKDGNEVLLFPDFTLREVSAFSAAWFRRAPEIPEWWDALLVEWKRQGHLAEPILGLKCDFLDGEGSEGFRNRLANYKPQSGGSGALTHLAAFRANDQIPFRKWGPGTGMVQQGHDSIVYQIPCDHDRFLGDSAEFGYCPPGCNCTANRTARFLEECMSFDGRKWGLEVDFFGEAKIGRTLKAV